LVKKGARRRVVLEEANEDQGEEVWGTKRCSDGRRVRRWDG